MHACNQQETTASVHASWPDSYTTLPNVIHVHALSSRPKGAHFPSMQDIEQLCFQDEERI
jgi:hypothetical protein